MVAQQREAGKEPALLGKEPLLGVEADLLEQVGRRRREARIALRVEPAQRDPGAAAEDLRVEIVHLRRGPVQMHRQPVEPGARQRRHLRRRVLAPRQVAIGVGCAGAGAAHHPHPQPRGGGGGDLEPERLQRRGGGDIARRVDLERPDLERGRQPEAAGDALVALAIGGVEIGSGFEPPPLGEIRRGEIRLRLQQRGRGHRRKISRQQLLQQRGGKDRELRLDLHAHARGEKRRPLQQPGEPRVEPVAGQPAETVRQPRKLGGEIGGPVVEGVELAFVEIEEFLLHRGPIRGRPPFGARRSRRHRAAPPCPSRHRSRRRIRAGCPRGGISSRHG